MNQKKPHVTYYTNTFNRRYLLENMLKSFDCCNLYDGSYEWIITDYGSTDSTRDFLIDYASKVAGVTLVLGDEKSYIEELERRNLAPANQRKKSHAIFGLSRNAARKLAKGDLFVEIADDHQFIRRGDWISDAINITADRVEKYGLDDISSIIYRGLSIDRIYKQNNETEPEEKISQSCSYFVAKHKCYDDYHIQKMSVFEKIGDYFEPHTLTGEIGDQWREGKDNINHYVDYLGRTKAAKMKKIFMKFPYAIDFPNPWHAKLNVPHTELIFPILEKDEIQKRCNHLDRPVSTDEILGLQ